MQFAWGMLKKVAIADRIAALIDPTLNEIGTSGGNIVWIAVLLYPIQMYTDFSGYSDMAIGIGKMLKINVAPNFNYPFFGRNIAEFWRRWHISLTKWLTDYVFMPLNIKFRDWQKWGLVCAIIINFVIVGMWHGATWNFAVFGLYHGLLFVPLIFNGSFLKVKKLKTNRFNLPHSTDVIKMLGTYLLVTLGLLIFRNITLQGFVSTLSGLAHPWSSMSVTLDGVLIVLLLALLLIHDIHGAFKTFPALDRLSPVARTSFYMFIIMTIGLIDNEKFIYFQF